MKTERISTLFERYMDGTASEAERYELSTYALMEKYIPLLKELEAAYWEKMKVGDQSLSDEEATRLMLIVERESKARVRFLSWRRVAVAASIILVLGTASYYAFFHQGVKKESIAKVEKKDVAAPDQSKAFITLENGRKIPVDSLTSLTQNNVSLVKAADSKIVYSGNADKIVYNTLTNPRGSQVIDMELSDGSHVWLNAGSSVTFPIAFVGNERKVEITGEAYFEVARDANKSFYVKKGDMTVLVLGTHFNVNAYDNEDALNVTLLEGSVKAIIDKGQSAMLKPGEQARIEFPFDRNANDRTIKVTNNVDLEQVMAWKNGQFVLKGTGIEVLMRQVERWYDVEVVYTGKIPNKKFGGSISRNVNLSTMLQALNDYGIHCQLKERKVIVE
jgi:ferric-dicitrate binding protein FerR (iron transport regulator)